MTEPTKILRRYDVEPIIIYDGPKRALSYRRVYCDDGEHFDARDVHSLLAAKDTEIARLKGDPAGGPSSIVGRAFHNAVVAAKDAEIARFRAMIPRECCQGADPHCYGPMGCLVRAAEAAPTVEQLRAEIADLRAERERLREDHASVLRSISRAERELTGSIGADGPRAPDLSGVAAHLAKMKARLTTLTPTRPAEEPNP